MPWFHVTKQLKSDNFEKIKEKKKNEKNLTVARKKKKRLGGVCVFIHLMS